MLITDPHLIADNLNDYFVSIGSSLAAAIPSTAVDYTKYLNKSYINSMAFSPTTPNEIISIVSQFQNKSSAGYDDIPVNLIKSIIACISVPLSSIINHSLINGIFPDSLKIAKVCPLFKCGDHKIAANYRPISVLPAFSKIFETVVSLRLTSYFTSQNIFSPCQYGFRKNHSTYMPLLEMYDKITQAIDIKHYSIGIFIDLAKAFDTIDHNLLLNKLRHYGVRGTVLAWFASYLSNRSQFVRVNSCSSGCKPICMGVPQGSVLGPLLFIIFINDLAACLTHLSPLLFADDTNLFYSNADIDVLRTTVDQELLKLSEWFHCNHLSLNVMKTNYILFGSRLVPLNCQICIDKQPLVRLYSVKFLGVIVDSGLRWNLHIDYICSKIAKGLGAMYRINNIIPHKLLLSLYYSMIYPYLNYCCIVWGVAAPSILEKLVVLQKRAVRILTHSERISHSGPLFKQLSVLKFVDICLLRTAEFMYKYATNLLPKSCDHYFSLADQTRPHYTRQSTLYKPLFARTNTRLVCISVQGPKLFNLLPTLITRAPSLFVFKHSLVLHLIAKY